MNFGPFTFRVLWCTICSKDRLHECYNDLGKCVRCEYVRDVPEKEVEFVG